MGLADYTDVIVKTAETYRIDANLIKAICMTESSGNPWKVRFEPQWRYFYNVNFFAQKRNISIPTEQNCQATSWGLGQIMGGVARELGFTEELPMLLDPTINLFYVGKKLRQLFDRHGDEEDVVAAYNAGSPRKTSGLLFENQKYVDKVYNYLRGYRKLA